MPEPNREKTDWAVEVLNRFRHRDYADWFVQHDRLSIVRGGDYYDILESFEAIAVAEKYMRDQPAGPLD
jgi:hypothetical protein